jgi:lipoate-protein ligase B
MKKIIVRNLGKLDYLKTLKVQESLWATRDKGTFQDTLLLVEHTPQVYHLL